MIIRHFCSVTTFYLICSSVWSLVRRHLHTESHLIKLIKNIVDVKNIFVLSTDNKVLNYYVEFISVGEREPRSREKMSCFFYIKSQSYSEGYRGNLARSVIFITLYFPIINLYLIIK